MTIKASGRSALIVAVGLFVCFAGPLPAAAAGSDSAAASKSDSATSGKAVRHGVRHWKRYAHRKHSRTAIKSAESDKSSEKTAGAADSPATIPAAVANANAQMTSSSALPSSALADSASAMTEKANTVLLASADQPADAQAPADTVVASDQLNDVDRALQETPPRQQTAALAVIRPTSATAKPAAASDNNTWDQTSLIGKLFIAFGALLTMASAARMFMA